MGLNNPVQCTRALPSGSNIQYTMHEHVSKPTGLTRTRTYSTKRALNTVDPTWVPRIVYNGLLGQVTDIKPDPIAPTIPTYSHSSKVGRIPIIS